MKFSSILLTALSGASSASAFIAPNVQQTRTNSHLPLNVVDTAMAVDPTYVIAGVGAAVSAIGGAAIAFGKNQQKEGTTRVPQANVEIPPEIIDVSIPYDATALLAYNTYSKNSSAEVDFSEFRNLYYQQMVAEVKASVQERKFQELKNEATSIKCRVDELFGSNNEKAEIVTDVESNNMDISIDYNAAAKLAYASSNKSMDFESFVKVYVADTVAMVAAKNPYK